MATYNQVSYGSQGSDVKTLQKLLNQNGYSLDEDGIFGSNTQAAVRDYQKKNSLDVDGIVGENTWGALTKGSGSGSSGDSSGSSSSTPTTPTYGAYTESDTVKQAEQMLQQQLANKPGAYQSAWQTQLNDVINKIMNREDFSYDLNGDALYQQYKDKYIQQGQMAMMDTMGQAAALTGGYGNSYAQSVGQQAYQAQLQNLNDIVPELYQMALDQYNQEGQDLLNQYSILGEQEEQDYGRYRDQLGDWQTERDYLAGRYDTERDYDYGKWADGRDFAYQQERDKAADEQWQAEFDEAKRQYDQQYALQNSGGSGGSGGDGGYDVDESDDTTGGEISASALVNMQYSLGVEPTGVWDEATAKASGYSTAEAAYKAWNKGLIGKSVNTQIAAANKAIKNFKITPKTAWYSGSGTYEDYAEAQIEKYVQELAKTDPQVAKEVGASLLIKYGLV